MKTSCNKPGSPVTLGSTAAMWIVALALLSVARVTPAKAFNVDSCHWAQWDTVLAQAESNPPARFGIYAYRTFAVAHPEVYLQSDSLFADIISRIPGSRSTWRGADVRNVEIFRRVQSGEARGRSFSFREWAPVLDSISDEGLVNPQQSWLDRRLTPAAILMHGPVQRLSTAEAAMLRYTQYRELGTPAESIYVVIDVDGHGYLVKNSEILSVQNNRPVAAGSDIVPALVFNEHSAYYPLLARDDREKSPSLKHVSSLLAEAQLPSLSPADAQRVAQLQTITALGSRRATSLAALVALGAVDVSLQPVADAWRPVIRDSLSFVTFVNGIVRTSIYWADRLSPRTAEFAALIEGDQIAGFAPALEQAYLAACGRPVDPTDSTNTELEAGGFIWSFEMFNLSFDDLVRIRTGQPASQALAMAAILDCRNVENTLVSLDKGGKSPTQNWVLAGEGRWQFNLGQWTHVPDSLLTRRQSPLALKSFMRNARWTAVEATRVITEADGLTTLSELSNLSQWLPTVFLRVPSPEGRERDLDHLIFELTNDDVGIHRMPWPQFEDGT